MPVPKALTTGQVIKQLYHAKYLTVLFSIAEWKNIFTIIYYVVELNMRFKNNKLI